MDIDLPGILVGAVLGAVAGAFVWGLAYAVRFLWHRSGRSEETPAARTDLPTPAAQPTPPPARDGHTAVRCEVAVGPPSARPPLTATVTTGQPPAGPHWPVVTVSVAAPRPATLPVVANGPGPENTVVPGLAAKESEPTTNQIQGP
jgi:hypothetical protein